MFGLIGKTLSHSFSKEIHEILNNESYNLIELQELGSFFKQKDFKGINVTIPYKQDVIKYLDVKSKIVEKTNSVNTIVNKDGYLYGYNTDYEGLKFLMQHNEILVENKSILILGNGSTSRTIEILCKELGSKNILKAARNPKNNDISFSDVQKYKNSHIIINATPSGMYPNNNDELLIDLKSFNQLEAVIDLVYNPLETKLISYAKSLNIKAVNGLLMLVRQAIKSCELFHNQEFNDYVTIDIYKNILFNMFNFVLIGMPMSGKSFYARSISAFYNKMAVDIDKQISNNAELEIPEIFSEYGEKGFREIETKIIYNVSKASNQVISTGGGTILNIINMEYLKQNGIIIFLDVPLEILKGMNPRNRPLLKNIDNLDKLYKDRYDLYLKYADIVINKTIMDESVVLKMIEVKINEYINTKWS